ncbi:hypothetical protein EVAR_43337_1 [Eumeta japonica]|uniref:Uncharacterized protein n=1 Tax=Eumeta variegata TaxID=151549 RepID=A0A4C1WP41_EUMVA|nr:hypothetical protein EVAR_43337_1 [Eumeta japonica]
MKRTPFARRQSGRGWAESARALTTVNYRQSANDGLPTGRRRPAVARTSAAAAHPAPHLCRTSAPNVLLPD